jgi:lysophospholipase L1-like esterase
MVFFRKSLALCKKEHIKCVVVNMPMAAAYRARLDSLLDKQYLTETQKACSEYNARYLDFNDAEFVDDDFSDGFHTNVVGAEKVLNRLVNGLLPVTTN